MTTKKITIHVPDDLLERAQKSTGLGVTETVRQGLRLVAVREVYDRVRDLRGKARFTVSARRLRGDRR